MTEPNGNGSGKLVQVKNWHVILILVLWAFTAIASYASLQAKTDQNSRDIERIREDQVSRQEFKEFHDDIIRRLDRIESKVDRDRAIRDLH